METKLAEEIFIEPDDSVFVCPYCEGLFREPMIYRHKIYCPHCGKEIRIEYWEVEDL